MKVNKTLTEKAMLFQRLKTRWKYLPTKMVFDIVMNHEVDEKRLDNNRVIKLKRELIERQRRIARKYGTNDSFLVGENLYKEMLKEING